MTQCVRGVWGTTRVLILAVSIAVVAWALADDARPVDASHTKIILSRSSTSPNALTSLLLPKNGTPQDFYVWAVNVHNSTGASAFDVRFQFNPAMGSITFLEWYGPPQYAAGSTWLGSTGRSPSCLGAIGPNAGLELGQAYTQCNTFLTPPPYGATGTGLLAHIRLQPGSQLMSGSQLDMRASFLVDTPPNPADQQPIAATAPLIYVTISKCADFDLNGTIDLLNDIFAIALRFGQSQGQAGWNSIYDMDDNGTIDLLNDIFNAAFQFGGSC